MNDFLREREDNLAAAMTQYPTGIPHITSQEKISIPRNEDIGTKPHKMYQWPLGVKPKRSKPMPVHTLGDFARIDQELVRKHRDHKFTVDQELTRIANGFLDQRIPTGPVPTLDSAGFLL